MNSEAVRRKGRGKSAATEKKIDVYGYEKPCSIFMTRIKYN